MGKIRQRWTHERLIKWFDENRPEWKLNVDKLPDKIEFRIKVEYECLICNFVNNQSINNIVSHGNGCVKCAGAEPWHQQRLINWFKENKPDCVLNVNKLPDKITATTKIEYECLICNCANNQSINNIISQDSGCVRCVGKERWTKTRLIEWYDGNKPGWILFLEDLPERLSTKTKIKTQCPNCRHVNKQTISNIVNRGDDCTKCSASEGHKLTAFILDKLKISYLEEWSSKNLKPNTRYRFDFALPQYKVIIEFHGEQHYETSSHNFGSKSRTKEELFVIVSRNDQKKREIVQNAGWYHLELHYDLKKTPAEIERLILETIYYNNF